MEDTIPAIPMIIPEIHTNSAIGLKILIDERLLIDVGIIITDNNNNIKDTVNPKINANFLIFITFLIKF